jgi:hypothetical protein
LHSEIPWRDPLEPQFIQEGLRTTLYAPETGSDIVCSEAMNPRILPLAAIAIALLPPTHAQTPAPTALTHLTAAEDHQRLLDLLALKELRPGVNGSPDKPNPVNYDESKANPWPTLPGPLVLNDGKPVTTPEIWTTQRRPELFELFDREVFGRVPANVPAVHWELGSIESISGEGRVPSVTKHLIGRVDNSAYPAVSVNIQMDLTTPAGVKTPVPVVLEFTFEKYPVNPNRPAAPAPPEVHPTWKEQVLAKGWGYALLYPTTIQADNGAGLTEGIIGLTSHGQPRKLDDWGVLRAWAWGGSRALDYLQTDRDVDARYIAVSGHSRFGKTALVAMAYDPRFAIAYINSSGAGGANLARRHFGEQLENIAGTGEYHWVDGNYLKYAGTLTPADLPVDTHELIALCAPRPVFIGGGTQEGGDGWADVRGTFIAEAAANPVYQLLGKKPLLGPDGTPTATFPPVGTALIAGDLAFRQHPGGHTPLPNYPTFITFASRYLPTYPVTKSTSTPAPK